MEVTGALSIKPSGNISLSTLTSVMTQPPSSLQPPIHEKDDLIPVSTGRHFLRRPNIPVLRSVSSAAAYTRRAVWAESASAQPRQLSGRVVISLFIRILLLFFHQDCKKKKTLGHHQDLTNSDTYRRYSPLFDAKNNKHDVTRCLKKQTILHSIMFYQP